MDRIFFERIWNICPFDSPSPGGPLILLLNGEESVTEKLDTALRTAGVPPMWLAFPLSVDWDRDYTPWPASGTGGREFPGRADGLIAGAAALRDELKRELGYGSVYAVGYSLGGLAALYLHISLALDGAGSCSGSLWYPGFTEYLAAHPPTGSVYLSLGGREKNTSDPLMRQNPHATDLALQICKASAKRTVFRSEPGGHFKDPPGRVSRAISWLCHQ